MLNGLAVPLLAMAVLREGYSTAAVVRPSAGCSSRDMNVAPWPIPGGSWWHMVVPDFTPVKRRALVIEPVEIDHEPTTPAPLLFGFHGQEDTAKDFAESHKRLITKSRKLGFVFAFPQGMDDADKKSDQGTGWNCGTAGVNSTCSLNGTDGSGCYESCRALGRCGPCNWNTCYDDKLFVTVLFDKIANNLCIDLNRVYLLGESNGAMLVHYLTQEMPGAFAAVVPWYGHPLLGYVTGADAQLIRNATAFRETSMLQLHGRSDTVIPPAGGETPDGWLYEPLEPVQRAWAAIHNCELRATSVSTSWDGGKKHFACSEYLGCTTGGRVMRCFYDGEHGVWPEGHSGDDITLWFVSQFRRGGGNQTRGGNQPVLV
mmetsp:Transcript_3646/g.9281  ORF Transcript_3646/g.9281 Transcript_3646/m.9281 type:complete len:372 (-) Transcript_3646:110-1225(-)